MAKDNELEIILSLVDNASAGFKSINQEAIKQLNELKNSSESVQKTNNELTDSFKEAGKEIEKNVNVYKQLSEKLQESATKLKSFGRDISQLGGSLSLLGGGISAIFIKALSDSSKQSIEVQNSLKNLKATTTEFSVSIANSVLPVINQLNSILRIIFNSINSISPQLRDSILQFTFWGAIILTVVGSLTFLIGKTIAFLAALKAIAGATLAWSAATNLAILPLIGIGIAVTSVIFLMLKFKPVADTIIGAFQVVFLTLKNGFLASQAYVQTFIAVALEGVAKVLSGLASIPGPTQVALTNLANNLNFAASEARILADRDLFNVGKNAKEIGDILTTGQGSWSGVFDELKSKAGEAGNAIRGVLSGSGGGGGQANELELENNRLKLQANQQLIQQQQQLKQLQFETTNNGILESQRMFSEQTSLLNEYKTNYMAAHASMAVLTVQLSQSIRTNLSSAIANIATGVSTAKEAFAQFGRILIQTVVQFMAQKVIAFALEKTLLAGTVAAASASAAVIGAAWAGPAFLATVATLGAAAAQAPAALAGAGAASLGVIAGLSAASKALVATSKFHSGGVVGGGVESDEVPIIAQSGEGILSRRGLSNLGGVSVLNALNNGQQTQSSQGGLPPITININGNISENNIRSLAEEIGFEIERVGRFARGI